MFKAIWVAGNLFSCPFPRPIEIPFRSSVGIAGSFIFHALLLSIGYSVTLQASTPKIKNEPSTFRWNISLSTAPYQEPVISDMPSNSLSVPTQGTAVAHSQKIDHSALSASNHNSFSTSKKIRRNPSAELSVRSKGIESSFNEHPHDKALDKKNKHTPTSRVADSHSPQLTQEKIYTMPFTHGREVMLPPPVKRVVDRAEQVRQPSTLEEPLVLQRPRPFQPLVRRLETRPDYGWLIDDLRIKLERLKFYPQVARLNKWQGQVVVQMKILKGGHLVDMEIEESSGFEVLDQTALAIVRQASPLNLVHPLLANNVMLSVPLTFQLE